MSNEARNHKDNVFCLLYRDKKNLLSLYNAVNGTSYEREEELEVVTLEEAICMKVRNDAAFVVDSTLNLYEQQSSVNPNMPLRDLYYVTEELKKIAPPGRLHRTTKVDIPMPRFLVFYNGIAEQPEKKMYKLSELFCRPDRCFLGGDTKNDRSVYGTEHFEEPELELKVTVYNINPGHNEELLKKCESLRGYAAFVKKVRDKKGMGIKLDTAVSQAVEECISEDTLAVFFREHKEEIVEMGIYEFDQELHDRVLLEDGESIGLEKGMLIGEKRGRLDQAKEDARRFYEMGIGLDKIARGIGYDEGTVRAWLHLPG